MMSATLRARVRREWHAFWLAAWPSIVLGLLALAYVLLTATPAAAAEVQIPEQSVRYRVALERAAGDYFGLNAPVARLAAQIHQESLWRPDAASAVAQGLGQFTPPTANWLPTVCPSVGSPDPWDPGWSIRALSCYDAFLHAQAPGADECNRWAFTFSDYNGGGVYRRREQQLARAAGKDASTWFDHVESFNARSAGAWRENRSYVRRILLLLEPAYISAGWDGKGACP